MLKFVLLGRSRSGTTITYDILARVLGDRVKKQCVDWSRFVSEQGGSLLTWVVKSPNQGEVWGWPPDGDLDQMRDLYPDLVYVYVYRDGRDCVSSGIRHPFGNKSYRKWKDPDVKVNSADWAQHMTDWAEHKRWLGSDRFCEVRMEDYRDHPGRNGKALARTLHLDPHRTVQAERALITHDKMHIGRYLDHLPDWERSFDKHAILHLKDRGYI